MKTLRLDTWYELKKFINDELTGKELGKPVQLLINDELYVITEVSKEKGDLVLIGGKHD